MNSTTHVLQPEDTQTSDELRNRKITTSIPASRISSNTPTTRTSTSNNSSSQRFLYNIVNHAPDEVALHAAILGAVFAVSSIAALAMLFWRDGFWQLPAYISALSAFHFLEYYITARYNPAKVNIDSFLVRNGRSYVFAHVFSLLEATTELYLLPFLKTHYLISLLGLTAILLGQAIRSLAMIHASSNFSHLIVHQREDSHKLVKTGLYSYTRHPSYFGYFLWALGTQVFLLNPVALVGFSIVLWRFFKRRIAYEEILLIQFFGKEYVEYKQTTGTLIPFIP
ncbi:protein-s-isoprenylcysteine O-methyltransferase [Myxozyma melibiosi]|uniref:Protein-S-isoprenylcysteine O-methyltransferase n=1 Tax=Myxozyma melibiosi TaxID=54550 RepID=A0ABR1F1B4_9ASCO